MPANERVKATEGRAYFQVLCYLEVRCRSRALVSALGALPFALGGSLLHSPGVSMRVLVHYCVWTSTRSF